MRGRSGRPRKRDERKRTLIIEKAWDLIGEFLESKDPKKMGVAKDIILKDIQGSHSAGQVLSKKSVNYKIEVVKVDGEKKASLSAPRGSAGRLGSTEQDKI